VLLSDIGGVYKNFGSSEQSLMHKVGVKEAKMYINAISSAHGTGGLATKIKAAEVAGSAGVATYLANAHEQNIINRTLKAQAGTRFVVE
jgi:glutamate 5-kinase